MRLPIVFLLIAILIFIQIILIKPFFHEGFFPTHDDIQTVRVFEYYQSLKFGELPPRWSSGLLYGYGYPLFIFYNPLVYFLGSIFVFLGFNFLVATKIVFILGFCIGVIGLFLLVKYLAGNFPAFIAAVIYSFVPYRAVDVYVRGDLAEFFSYSFFPWVFLINLKLLKTQNNVLLIYLYAVSIAVMILLHNISAFIYAIFLVIFNIFYIVAYVKNRERFKMVKKLLLGLLLAFLISSFYWFPLIMEIHFVQFDRVASFPYYEYFLTIQQIWQSPWGYGGFLQKNPMSLQLGQSIIVISLLTLIFNLLIKTYYRKVIFFLEIIFVVSIILETKTSQFFWDQVVMFQYLQFPWRLHILNTICGTILVGFFFYLLENIKIYKYKIKRIVILSAGILFILISFRESIAFFKESSFFEAKPVAATTTGEEYLPKWVNMLPNNYPQDKVEFINSDGKFENIEWGYHQKKFTIINQNEARIKIAHIYYPGWVAYVNNNKTKINYHNQFAQMEIEVPKGTSSIAFIFTRTWWRLVADVVSVVSLLGVIFLTAQNIIQRKKVELRR